LDGGGHAADQEDPRRLAQEFQAEHPAAPVRASGAERYAYSYPFIERVLTVGIEMRVTVNRDDDKPGHLAERLLSVVERVVMQNCTWGGLAIDTNFKNNELGMQSYVDKTVDGVLWIEIHYRHQQGDPRDPDPSL
jgi:hypothetical protein